MATQANEKETGIVTTNKDETAVNVTAVEEEKKSSESSDSTDPCEAAWKPGFRAQFPWTGFACLCTVITCSIGAVIVLITTDHKTQQQWNPKIGPNVLLSILNNVASICITLAVGQGIAIAWWRKALKGATIKELHHSWNFGASLSAVVTKYKYFNSVALAALMTKFAVIDGVLFQRSTTTYAALGDPHDTNITTYPTEDFPVTAYLKANSTSIHHIDYQYSWDTSYWINSPMGRFASPYGFDGCKGKCEVKVPGLGFAVSCSTTSEPVDTTQQVDNYYAGGGTGNMTEIEIFNLNFTSMFPTAQKNYTWIQMLSKNYLQEPTNDNSTAESCPATMSHHICELRPALVEYPLVIQFINRSTANPDQRDTQNQVEFGILTENGILNDSMLLSFDAASMNQLGKFKVLRYIDVYDEVSTDDMTGSKIAGITDTLTKHYGSRAWLSALGTNGSSYSWELNTEGQWAPAIQVKTWVYDDDNKVCPYSFPDSSAKVVSGVNALMMTVTDNIRHRDGFYEFIEDDANAWANFTAANKKMVVGAERVDEVYYKSHWNFMAGALASTFVCILCILPAYWGFWQLGRKVTLGPFEIANAFQAPVLANTHNGNGHADHVLKAAGSSKVKYMEYTDEKVGRNYRFDAHDNA